MAEDPTGRHLGKVTLQDVQVAPADGGGVDHDDGIGGVDHLRVGYFVPTLLVGTVVDECFHGMFPLFVVVETGLPGAVPRTDFGDGAVGARLRE